MSEKKFSANICGLLKRMGAHVTRIETSTESGVSDIDVCYEGNETWLELKWGHPKLRPRQHAWMMKRSAAGGHVYVLLGSPRTIRCWKYPIKIYALGKYVMPVDEPNIDLPRKELKFMLQTIISR